MAARARKHETEKEAAAAQPVAAVGVVDVDSDDGDLWGDDNSQWEGSSLDFSKEVRFVDKLKFVVGVLNVVVVSGVFFARPLLLYAVYAVKFPILITARYIMYKGMNWHLFLLDFCYFGNALVLVYLFFAWGDARVFLMAFGIATGPLSWAVFLFHNSLVFHSFSHITSLYIHLTPPMVMYCLRWYAYPERFAVCVDEECSAPFTWLVGAPLLYFIGHQLVYLILFKARYEARLKRDKKMLTSYRVIFNERHRKGPAWKLVNIFGEGGRVYVWGILNDVYCLASLLLAPVWYTYQEAHFVFLAVMLVAATWNGASFYCDYFSWVLWRIGGKCLLLARTYLKTVQERGAVAID